VDVTKYLVSQYQHPDKVISINTPDDKPKNAEFHIKIPE